MVLETGQVHDMREFEGGATRDCDQDKLDFEGFLSPEALTIYAEYMHRHRQTAKGLRDSDNWQAGMPLPVYMKSAFRHLVAWWGLHRQGGTEVELKEAICGVLFNAFGYLHQLGKVEDAIVEPGAVRTVPEAVGIPGYREGERPGKVGPVGPRDRDYVGPGSGAREG